MLIVLYYPIRQKSSFIFVIKINIGIPFNVILTRGDILFSVYNILSFSPQKSAFFLLDLLINEKLLPIIHYSACYIFERGIY